jgi:hypothetical protein
VARSTNYMTGQIAPLATVVVALCSRGVYAAPALTLLPADGAISGYPGQTSTGILNPNSRMDATMRSTAASFLRGLRIGKQPVNRPVLDAHVLPDFTVRGRLLRLCVTRVCHRGAWSLY